MKRSRRWSGVTFLAVALLSFGPVLQAGTTTMDVQLGDAFSGSIGEAGVDTFEARFVAAPGRTVKLTVQAARGSTLRPTVVIKDASGTPLSSGSTRQIGWLPVGNLVHNFEVPVIGTYTAEIGGSSGGGTFLAKLSGSPVDLPLTTLSGTVTDSLTAAPISGASVLADGSPFATTNASGAYSGSLAPGSYSVAFQASGYESETRAVNLSSGTPVVLNVSLVPLVPVTVDASVSGDAVAGGVLTATVDISAPPGAVIESILWTQEYGVPVMIVDEDTDEATVTLGAATEYKDELIHVLSEPPIGEEQLPPSVPLPEGEFPGGLQDRLQVVGINPFALEEAALVVLKVEVVVTDLGTFSDEVEIHAELGWKWTTGLRNVPQGIPVLLHAPEQPNGEFLLAPVYDWTFDPPPGSDAVLMDDTTQNPYFTPDIPGLYEIELGAGDAKALSILEVYAGTWRGTIVDQDMDGRPVADTACTFCHNGEDAADEFTPWMQTGHAEIFTNNLNTSTHYGGSCFPCHTVGYDPDIENGGVDEAEDYEDFLGAGLINNPGDNWTTVLEEFPETARLANIQCENCHGPQDSLAHGFAPPEGEGMPRISLSSDVCAYCHGEPLRHARFQQWQLSAHANYELAIEEGESGGCSKCHTVNGFLAWLPVLLGEVEGDVDDDVEVTWTEDEVHPQTCVTCHDPHDVGTASGNNTNAPMRIEGDTPELLAGYQVTGVGGAAICMTCHNSRRGERNDDVFDDLSATEKARAPHPGTQTDVLVGQNAYFMELPRPGGHAEVEDACVACHMQETPPPDVLSYNRGGANHTFYASPDICAECHSPHLRAEDVQNGIEFLLEQVKDLLEESMLDLLREQTDAGYTVDLNGDATITDADDVTAIEFTETRGREAITVTLTTGGPYGPHRLQDIDVLGGPMTLALNELADPAILKAGWNYLLFHADGSLGVHNPFFASDSLVAARNALVAASGESAPTIRRLRALQAQDPFPKRSRALWKTKKDRLDR